MKGIVIAVAIIATLLCGCIGGDRETMAHDFKVGEERSGSTTYGSNDIDYTLKWDGAHFDIDIGVMKYGRGDYIYYEVINGIDNDATKIIKHGPRVEIHEHEDYEGSTLLNTCIEASMNDRGDDT